MLIERDTTKLNPEFPFLIMNVTLKREDNIDDSFHWHSFCEITYVKKGKGNYFVNGVRYDMGEGDLIVFNNTELHGWTVLDESMELIVMMFPTEFVATPVSLFDSEYLQPFIERGSNFKNKVSAEDKETKEITRIMTEIMNEWNTSEVGNRLMIRADVLRILTLLIRYYQNTEDPDANKENLSDKKKSMKRLEEAFYYMNAHYTEKITLDEVAKSVYMSPNYFSGYFRKVTNSSFSDYITKLRLEKVREMEKTTDLNIAQIAMACGFHNMSNFYRLYKKHFGDEKRGR